MKSLTKYGLFAVGLLLSSTWIGSQIPPIPTTPNLPTAVPREVTRGSAGWRERLSPKKWRRKYNTYEMSVLLWQLYQGIKSGADWKEIFGRMSGLMGDELALHQDHYNQMRSGGEFSYTYHVVRRLIADFRTIIQYGKEIAEFMEQPGMQAITAEAEFIHDVSREIKNRAIGTLEYLPVVAGMAPEEMPEGDDGQPVGSIDKEYWATPQDRIEQMDRMFAELTELKNAMRRLHHHVRMVSMTRGAKQRDRSAGELLFGKS